SYARILICSSAGLAAGESEAGALGEVPVALLERLLVGLLGVFLSTSFIASSYGFGGPPLKQWISPKRWRLNEAFVPRAHMPVPGVRNACSKWNCSRCWNRQRTLRTPSRTM